MNEALLRTSGANNLYKEPIISSGAVQTQAPWLAIYRNHFGLRVRVAGNFKDGPL
jgi:hypothetical protein